MPRSFITLSDTSPAIGEERLRVDGGIPAQPPEPVFVRDRNLLDVLVAENAQLWLMVRNLSARVEALERRSWWSMLKDQIRNWWSS